MWVHRRPTRHHVSMHKVWKLGVLIRRVLCGRVPQRCTIRGVVCGARRRSEQAKRATRAALARLAALLLWAGRLEEGDADLGSRVRRKHFVLRPGRPGRPSCLHCRRSTPSAATLERCAFALGPQGPRGPPPRGALLHVQSGGERCPGACGHGGAAGRRRACGSRVRRSGSGSIGCGAAVDQGFVRRWALKARISTSIGSVSSELREDVDLRDPEPIWTFSPRPARDQVDLLVVPSGTLKRSAICA